MPAAPVIISAVGTAYGAYSANQANKKAGDFANMQEDAYRRDLALRQGFMDERRGLYGPLEQSLVQQAASPLPLFYGQMEGPINQNFNAADRGLSSTMAQRGLAGSPVEAATRGGLQLGRAGALATAFQTGLQNRLQLAQGVLSRYQPDQNVQMVSQGLGQLGGFYGQRGALYGQAAQQGWGAVAQGLGQLGEYFQTQDYLDSLKGEPSGGSVEPNTDWLNTPPTLTPPGQTAGLGMGMSRPIYQGQGFDFSGSNIGSGVATGTTSAK